MIVVENSIELKRIIKQRIIEQGPNCDLNDIDVSRMKSMTHLFCGSTKGEDKILNSFNGDISHWDVRHVEDMRLMFFMSMFKGDISKWDVQEDTNMESMFNQSSLERANKLPAWYNNSTMTI